MKELKFTIPMDPVTKKNSQQLITLKRNGSCRRIVVPSKKYRNYEEDARAVLSPVEPVPAGTAVNVKALFYMRTRRHVDLTNLNEALHDTLVRCGILEDDNCCVIVSTDGSRVYYDYNCPRTEVTITETERTFEFAARK